MITDPLKYIPSLTDYRLLLETEECYHALLKAGNEVPNTPWHEACFAAFVSFVGEMGKRGLKRPPAAMRSASTPE